MNRTVHFVYVVPTARSRIIRRLDRLATETNAFAPSYRSGADGAVNWPNPTHAPFSITRALVTALRSRYQVRLYDWFERGPCRGKPGDIFLVHPKPDYSSGEGEETSWKGSDRNSIGFRTLERGFPGRSIIILPHTGEVNSGWVDELFERSSREFIAICAKRWTENWKASFGNRVNRLLQVDMAVDVSRYPRLKTRFNPPGKRKFLYIGHTGAGKNIAQLEAIAHALPGFNGAHLGAGTIRGWPKISGPRALTPEFLSELADEFDVFVSTSNADAQATTILEQMSIGMPVACTPESGYDHPSICRLDVQDTALNCAELQRLQQADEGELMSRADENRLRVETHHTWDRFCERILNFLETEQ